MLRMDVAQALRDEGHDVVRASEVGNFRAYFFTPKMVLSTFKI
jgi:outer membrane lipopolysaccharide assembly protein LptE/RlpB